MENYPSLEEYDERGPQEETSEVGNDNFVSCDEGITELDHLKTVIIEKDETILNLENNLHVKDAEIKELTLRLSKANKQLENPGSQIWVCK